MGDILEIFKMFFPMEINKKYFNLWKIIPLAISQITLTFLFYGHICPDFYVATLCTIAYYKKFKNPRIGFPH